MQKRTALAGIVLLLWLLLLPAVPSSAQQDTAATGESTPATALTVGAVDFCLFIGPEVNSSYTGPYFSLDKGTLSLIDRGSLGKSGAVLWAGPLAKDPQTFTIKVGEHTEELDDAAGAPLWTHSYEPPALTLDLATPQQPDLKRQGTLRDASGHTLWSGELTLSHGSSPAPKVSGVSTETRGWFRYQWGNGTASLLDTQGQTLWSGQPLGNMGLLVRDSQEHGFSETLGIPGPALPPGKVLTLTISAVDGVVTLQDADRQALARVPVSLGRFTVASNNSDNNRFFTPGTTLLTPETSVTLPPHFAGTLALVYQMTDGTLVQTKQTTVTWGPPFQAPDGEIKAHREKKTQNYDADGKETGSSSMAGDELLSDSP